MQRLEFALARTALGYGLQWLGLAAGDVVLVPDFVCDVVWYGVQHAGFVVATYSVTDALLPDWEALSDDVRRSGARALLVVHYFGQPQDMRRCRAFCEEHGLWLVEDNAHGYSGTDHGQLLGTLGDCGIASPRKLMGTASGGVLYYRHGDAAQLAKARTLPAFPAGGPLRLAKTALARFPRMKSRIKGVLNLRLNWSDPRMFREREKPDYAIDEGSHRFLATADWQTIAHQRRSAWVEWSEFARQHGLVPVFPAVHPESCPWALPVYSKDLEDRNRWLTWGARNGLTLFPWPSLPEQVIIESGPALARWKRLCCFSLDHAPE